MHHDLYIAEFYRPGVIILPPILSLSPIVGLGLCSISSKQQALERAMGKVFRYSRWWSWKLVPVESPCATSYQSSIVAICLYFPLLPRYIWRFIGRNSAFFSAFRQPSDSRLKPFQGGSTWTQILWLCWDLAYQSGQKSILHGKNWVIVRSFVLSRYHRVTDMPPIACVAN